MKMLRKTVERIEGICLAGSCLALMLIMVLTTVDVAVRKLSDVSIPGLFEFTEDYLMVAIVFLAVSHVYRSGGHVKVNLFERTIPRAFRRPTDLLKNFAALGFFALIAAMGWQSAADAMAFGEISHGAVAYPLAPALFMVPVGAGLTCIRIVQELVRHDRTQEEESK